MASVFLLRLLSAVNLGASSLVYLQCLKAVCLSLGHLFGQIKKIIRKAERRE